MSRNYELFHKIENERWPTEARLVPAVARATAQTPDLDSRTFTALAGLVQNLFLSTPKPMRQVVFSGVEPGVGTAWIVAHVAQALCSQVEATVCLVDARVASTHGMDEYFRPPFQPEWAQKNLVLAATKRVAGNLRLPSARNHTDDNAAIDNDYVDVTVRELRKQFAFVLIAAPPICDQSAVLPLTRMADGIVLILKAGYTRRTAVRAALQHLRTANVKVLGTVLNQRTYSIPQCIYKWL